MEDNIIQDVPFKQRLKGIKLAPDIDDYTYKIIPVDQFGIKMLKDMGYYQGRKIGKNTKNCLQKIVQPIIRPNRLGLGAEYGLNINDNQIQKGKRVKFISGIHQNLSGIIIQIVKNKQQIYKVKLDISSVVVNALAKDIQILKQDLNKAIKKKVKRSRSRSSQGEISWLKPFIKVRVIDKNSDYYLKKIIIVDVIKKKAYCKTQDNKIVKIKQKYLETVIPKIGQNIIIVKGQHKGQKAILKQKGSKTVVVQTKQQLQILQLKKNEVTQIAD